MALFVENGRLTNGEFIWAEGEFHPFGEAFAPKGIKAEVSAEALEEGKLSLTAVFTNTTAGEICVSEGEMGVWLPYNDSLESAEVCLSSRCHAHIYCCGRGAWTVCVPMNSKKPYLGAILREGRVYNYGVERQNTSNDRGDFAFYAEKTSLLPGESYTLQWTFFEFEKDFYRAFGEYPEFLSVTGDTFTFFEGEAPTLTVNGEKREFSKETGVHTEEINGSRFSYRVVPALWDFAQRRCEFIVKNQQESGGALDGAYVPFDNETKKRDYRDDPNHNAGRERIGMGLLTARFLQKKPNKALEASLDRYIEFVLREHFDESTGEVFNELNRDNHRRRIYNNAWYALFFLEIYRLKGDKHYLRCMYGAFCDLYSHGGIRFYPLAMEITASLNALKEAQMTAEYASLLEMFIKNGEFILQNGINYPKLEVNYEDNIVVPAGFVMCQLYEVTGERKYLEEAKKHLALHKAFEFVQPDFRQFRAAIHHWDDFWFGKSKLYGDTFPHYWTGAGAVFSARMGKCLGDMSLIAEARATMRTSLSCFFFDGSATCAIFTPLFSNGAPGAFIDALANDQDWAMYFCLAFDEAFGI